MASGSKTWRAYYEPAKVDIKAALAADGISLLDKANQREHFFFVVRTGEEPRALVMPLGRTGRWSLDARGWAVLDVFQPIAIFLTDRTRGYVVGPEQFQHLRHKWSKDATGRYVIDERSLQERGYPRFFTAEECAGVVAELMGVGDESAT